MNGPLYPHCQHCDDCKGAGPGGLHIVPCRAEEDCPGGVPVGGAE